MSGSGSVYSLLSHFCATGYSAVAFDGAGNYGHTPTHHSSQFSNHSFKHEDALAQQSTMGKRVFEYTGHAWFQALSVWTI